MDSKFTQFDDYLWRGPQPTQGDLQQKLFSATLDLETGKKIIGDGSPLYEAMIGDMFGVRVYSHPLGVFFPPTFQELLDGIYFLKMQRKKKINTLVHCAKGVDRTGMTVAAYRIFYQGWTFKAAVKEMLQMGMHRWYVYWIPQLLFVKRGGGVKNV